MVFLFGNIDQKLTSQVHEIVGRINGRFGTLTAVPIHHLVSSFLSIGQWRQILLELGDLITFLPFIWSLDLLQSLIQVLPNNRIVAIWDGHKLYCALYKQLPQNQDIHLLPISVVFFYLFPPVKIIIIIMLSILDLAHGSNL